MRVKILNRYWRLVFCTPYPDGSLGLCDHPDTPKRTIHVVGTTRGVDRLDALIHECLHAASWELSHSLVENTAEHLAGVLWEWGWRECGGDEDCSQSSLARVIAHCLRIMDSSREYDSANWATSTAEAIARVLWRLGHRLE